MISIISFLSILALVAANIWHSVLLWRSTDTNRPHTISHHAASSPYDLLTHRIVHIIAAGILIVFSLLVLLPSKQYVAGVLLVFGGMFDMFEAITLTKKNSVVTV